MLDKDKKLLKNPKETKELNEYKVRTKDGKEFVKNFTIYEINMDINDIIKVTGLSKEEIEKLK